MTNPRPSVFDNGQQHRFEGGADGSNTAPQPPPLTEDMALRLVFAETVSQKTANGTITADMMVAERNSGLYLDAGLIGIDPDKMAQYLAEGQTEKQIVEHHYKMAEETAKKNHRENHVGKEKEESKEEGEDDAKNDDLEETKEEEEAKDKEETKQDADKTESKENDNINDKKSSSNKRPASPSADSEQRPKKAKLKAWLPDPSRHQSQTEKRIHDALLCIGAIN